VQTELQTRSAAVLDPFAAWLMLRGLRTLADPHAISIEASRPVSRQIPQRTPQPSSAFITRPCPRIRTTRSRCSNYTARAAFSASHSKSKPNRPTTAVVDALKLFHIGVSWGGHESLALAADFFSIPPEETQWCIRIHVGLETPNDLIEDLKQALEKL
jgi:cystathionine beta-lyase